MILHYPVFLLKYVREDDEENESKNELCVHGWCVLKDTDILN